MSQALVRDHVGVCLDLPGRVEIHGNTWVEDSVPTYPG